ncbi:hypothetical protein KBY66_01765 [Synechococcus sp. Tobar12-5m-g]|uniref:hypothetical protein n=1 Tax=unclassified Synechococcus TaxID=2626047 RepID=UPI0020CEBC62|nr:MULTISPECIES: hypothetical protein [unclassified Synechococcus]MCP9771364.1 hypothetical protein [Synechococcus sp. Tobar12-5m-g]MCP9872303.1 hypothetical protein [Synechococcus sp. Cruz CV-v-12]
MPDSAAAPVPASAPSFPQAMEITAQWIGLWEGGELSDEVLAERVGELVASRDGARGFFVVALAGDSALLDRLPEPLAQSLLLAGEGVVDLTVRNLAMSTAMAVQHGRQGDEQQQGRSERVQRRCAELLQWLDPTLVGKRLEVLLEATAGSGEDVSFLKRWGYDQEQTEAIAAAIRALGRGD